MRFGIMAKIAEKIEMEAISGWNDNLKLQLSELKAEWEIVREIVREIIQQKIN